MNFTSDMFRQFCRQMNIEWAIKLLYHYQSNNHMQVCIKVVKHTIKKYLHNKTDINLVLLQKRSVLIGTGLPSPATL